MKSYRVEINDVAAKQFRKLDRSDQLRLKPKIEALEKGLNASCKKLQGSKDLYRLRVGDFRVIFEVKNARLLVLVIRIAHRREVYRDF